MYEIEIARGMALLDEQRPGWEAEIDLERFTMLQGSFNLHVGDCGCICAQLDAADCGATGDYANFARGLLGLDAWGMKACAHGFLGHEDDERYAQLTHEWRVAIEARRAA